MISLYEFLAKKHLSGPQYELVDLDLPNGVKWASCNIGAKSPEDIGLYFLWGRHEGEKLDSSNKFISSDEYLHGKKITSKKYKKKESMSLKDDEAFSATHGELCMPTVEDLDILLANTNYEWTEIKGVEGVKFVSKKDKSKFIFIPVSGYYTTHEKTYKDKKDKAYFWTASTTVSDSTSAYVLSGDKYRALRNFTGKYLAMPIRGIHREIKYTDLI